MTGVAFTPTFAKKIVQTVNRSGYTPGNTPGRSGPAGTTGNFPIGGRWNFGIVNVDYAITETSNEYETIVQALLTINSGVYMPAPDEYAVVNKATMVSLSIVPEYPWYQIFAGYGMSSASDASGYSISCVGTASQHDLISIPQGIMAQPLYTVHLLSNPIGIETITPLLYGGGDGGGNFSCRGPTSDNKVSVTGGNIRLHGIGDYWVDGVDNLLLEGTEAWVFVWHYRDHSYSGIDTMTGVTPTGPTSDTNMFRVPLAMYKLNSFGRYTRQQLCHKYDINVDAPLQ
jgi:hypothetical protein